MIFKSPFQHKPFYDMNALKLFLKKKKLSEINIGSGVGFYSLSPMFMFPSALHHFLRFLFPFTSLCDLWRTNSSEILEEKGVCAAVVCGCSWYLHKKEIETDGWKDSAACENMSLIGKEMLSFFNLKLCSFGIKPRFEEICLNTLHKMQQLQSKSTVASISAESAICCRGCAVFSMCQEQWRDGAPIAIQVEVLGGETAAGQGTILIEMGGRGSGWEQKLSSEESKVKCKSCLFQA